MGDNLPTKGGWSGSRGPFEILGPVPIFATGEAWYFIFVIHAGTRQWIMLNNIHGGHYVKLARWFALRTNRYSVTVSRNNCISTYR